MSAPDVVAVRWGRLGDLICTWPALSWLAADLEVGVLTAPALRPLLRLAVPSARVLDEAPTRARVLLDLHGVAASRRASRGLVADTRIATDKESWRRRALLWGAPVGWRPRWTWAQRHLRAAARVRSLFGLAGDPPDPRPSLDPAALGVVRDPRALGVVLGAGHATKVWPTRHAVELLRAWPGPAVAICGRDEGGLAAAIPPDLCVERPGDPVALARLLAGLGHAVGGDTGPMHLAAAVGCRVRVLLGPTPAEAGFWPEAAVLRPAVPCAPCSLHGGPVCPRGHHRCLEDRDAASVLAAWSAP